MEKEGGESKKDCFSLYVYWVHVGGCEFIYKLGVHVWMLCFYNCCAFIIPSIVGESFFFHSVYLCAAHPHKWAVLIAVVVLSLMKALCLKLSKLWAKVSPLNHVWNVLTLYVPVQHFWVGLCSFVIKSWFRKITLSIQKPENWSSLMSLETYFILSVLERMHRVAQCSLWIAPL